MKRKTLFTIVALFFLLTQAAAVSRAQETAAPVAPTTPVAPAALAAPPASVAAPSVSAATLTATAPVAPTAPLSSETLTAHVAAPSAPAAPSSLSAPLAPPAAVRSAPAVIAAPAVLAAPQAPVSPSAQPAPVAPPVPPAFVSALQLEGNYLGVEVEEITRANMSRFNVTGEPRGVAVVRVLKGSPAERAGLRENDVIVRFDGETLTSVRKLNRLVSESSPEHNARLTILRGGAEQEFSATLGKREGLAQSFAGFNNMIPPAQMEEMRKRAEAWSKQGEQWKLQGELMRKQFGEMGRNNPGLFNNLAPFATSFGAGGRRIGVATTPVGKQLADYFGVSRGRGLLVTSVEDNSPASKAGLKAGDVIVEVDGQSVENASDIARELSRKEQGEVTVTVVRERKERNFKLTPERRPDGGLLLPRAYLASPVVLNGSATAPRLVAPRALTSAPRVLRMTGVVSTSRTIL